MAGVPGHTRRKYTRICRLCGEVFEAKHPRAQVCPAARCQDDYKRERDRNRKRKKRAAEAEEGVVDA